MCTLCRICRGADYLSFYLFAYQLITKLLPVNESSDKNRRVECVAGLKGIKKTAYG
jgi:hypothetical protein